MNKKINNPDRTKHEFAYSAPLHNQYFCTCDKIFKTQGELDYHLENPDKATESDIEKLVAQVDKLDDDDLEAFLIRLNPLLVDRPYCDYHISRNAFRRIRPGEKTEDTGY